MPHNSYTQFDIREKKFSYQDNSIKVTLNFYNANLELNASNSFQLLLDENGLIMQELQEDINNKEILSYQSGNVQSYTEVFNDNPVWVAEYEYTDIPVSDEYQFRKYIYGSQWKINFILDEQFNVDYGNAHLISENYIEGYSYTRTEDNETLISFSSSYEFDSDGKLVRQLVVEDNLANNPFNIEYSYSYDE